jgi:hypothetical protein
MPKALFRPGESGNPRGRPPGNRASKIVLWDLKHAARQHCPKALARIVEALDDEDKRIRLLAAELLLERGYGKPEMHADIEINHRFVVAPQTMGLDEWLACKGQPAPNRWLEPKATSAQDTQATLVERASDTSEYSEASTRPELSAQPNSKTGRSR